MVLTLSLATLGLAAVSDGEKTGEEDWAERFSEINANRETYGIPLLTTQEKFCLLLGKPPIRDNYRIGIEYIPQENELDGEKRYGLTIHEVDVHWFTKGGNWVYLTDLFLSTTFEEKALEKADELSKAFFILFDRDTPCDWGKPNFQDPVSP